MGLIRRPVRNTINRGKRLTSVSAEQSFERHGQTLMYEKRVMLAAHVNNGLLGWYLVLSVPSVVHHSAINSATPLPLREIFPQLIDFQNALLIMRSEN